MEVACLSLWLQTLTLATNDANWANDSSMCVCLCESKRETAPVSKQDVCVWGEHVKVS